MKKLLISIALMACIPVLLHADPAKKVNLSYTNGTLKIEAIHVVKNVNDHYIDQIIVLVDGKEVKTIKPTKQSSLQAEVMEISLPGLKPGAVIEVKTRCNEFGNKSGKLTL